MKECFSIIKKIIEGSFLPPKQEPRSAFNYFLTPTAPLGSYFSSWLSSLRPRSKSKSCKTGCLGSPLVLSLTCCGEAQLSPAPAGLSLPEGWVCAAFVTAAVVSLTDHYGALVLPCLLQVSGRLAGVCSALDRCKGRGEVLCQLFLLTEHMQFSPMFSRPARIPVLAFASSSPVALADQGPRAEHLHPP